MSAERKAAKAANRKDLEEGRQLRYAAWFEVVWRKHGRQGEGNSPMPIVRLAHALLRHGSPIVLDPPHPSCQAELL